MAYQIYWLTSYFKTKWNFEKISIQVVSFYEDVFCYYQTLRHALIYYRDDTFCLTFYTCWIYTEIMYKCACTNTKIMMHTKQNQNKIKIERSDRSIHSHFWIDPDQSDHLRTLKKKTYLSSQALANLWKQMTLALSLRYFCRATNMRRFLWITNAARLLIRPHCCSR